MFCDGNPLKIDPEYIRIYPDMNAEMTTLDGKVV